MNKKLLIIFMFVLAFMFMPIVNAEEIPREGVTYFLQYPDGSEDVTESYDEAITYPEKVIFEGVTNANGQVTIEGLGDTGELRIVEEVPDGYTSKENEIKVDLSQKKSVEITNNSRFTKTVKNVLTNPKTGMSFLLFVFIIGLTIYTIKTRKNRKLLVLVPVLLGIALVSNVKAANSDFTVTVKDNSGNGLSNVPVKVYAKAINIDAQPAIKYDANGGNFFDGTTTMYVRIPYNGCNWDDFYESLSENDFRYISENTLFSAYRDGYYVDNIDRPDTLSNGTVIKTYWGQDSNASVVNVHLNGETIDFYGHKLNKISMYSNNLYRLDYMKIIDKYFGLSKSSSCENVPIGIKSLYRLEKLGNTKDIYLCYSDKPDGIYINDDLIRGNVDTCFMESHNSGYNENDNTVVLSGNSFNTYIYNLSGTNMILDPVVYDGGITHTPLTKIEIVNNGKTIVSVGSNDSISGNIEDGFYIDNIEKNNQIKYYLNQWINKIKNGQCPFICDYEVCVK